jgi:hypothetical protein
MSIIKKYLIKKYFLYQNLEKYFLLTILCFNFSNEYENEYGETESLENQVYTENNNTGDLSEENSGSYMIEVIAISPRMHRFFVFSSVIFFVFLIFSISVGVYIFFNKEKCKFIWEILKINIKKNIKEEIIIQKTDKKTEEPKILTENQNKLVPVTKELLILFTDMIRAIPKDEIKGFLLNVTGTLTIFKKIPGYKNDKGKENYNVSSFLEDINHVLKDNFFLSDTSKIHNQCSIIDILKTYNKLGLELNNLTGSYIKGYKNETEIDSDDSKKDTKRKKKKEKNLTKVSDNFACFLKMIFCMMEVVKNKNMMKDNDGKIDKNKYKKSTLIVLLKDFILVPLEFLEKFAQDKNLEEMKNKIEKIILSLEKVSK